MPIILSADANPSIIESNGTDNTLLNVTATDNGNGIASVTINLSAIGGLSAQAMTNYSGVWQFITNTTTFGTFELPVNVTDNAGNSNTSVTILLIATGTTLPVVIDTLPKNLATDVKIGSSITATFSEPMNSSTLNINTVKLYDSYNIYGETFEDINGSWNFSNFQGFIYAEQLMVSPQPVDDFHRTIGEGNITYSTQHLLKDYLIYTNKGIEVEGSGNYSVMGWLGDENVVINTGSSWIITKPVFEQNSTDTKTLLIGETWDLGDGYSLKLLEIDVDGEEAWLALNDSSGEIDNEVCQNQSACIFDADLGGYDDSPIVVTYLNKVNMTPLHIELKYTWVISQNTTEIQNGQPFGDFRVRTSYNLIVLDNDEDIILSKGDTIPLFDDFKFEVEDTSTVRYRLTHQAEPPVGGDISYNSSSRTVTFNPVLNLNENTDYFPLITTGAENLAGNGLTEDYIWTFRTIDTTPPIITDLNTVVNSSTATITWNTIGDPSNSTVKYNESGNLTILQEIDSGYFESHTIHLDSLQANTTYYYSVVNTDQSGNTNESSIQTFTTPTILKVTIHSPPVITNDSTPLLNATFNRIVISAGYVLDGAAGIGGNHIDHLIINLPELSDGSHRVIVDAIDYEGGYIRNIGTAIQNFIVDSTLPTTAITEPYDEAYIKGTIDIIGTANDTNFKNYLVEWKNTSVDWTEIQNSTVFVSDGTLATWDSISLEDGNYTIKLTVKDNASNSNMTLVNVTIDNTAPAVINVMAQPDIINISGYTNITADVSDPDVDNVSVMITYPNGTHSTIDMDNSSHVYYRNFSNTADPGRYNVTIIASDTTGNVNDTQKTSFVVAHIYTNTTITTNAGNSTFINAPSTDVTLELFTNDSVNGSINITRSIVNITNELEVSGPGIYIRIDASTNFSNDNYSNLSWALIKVNYTAEDVSKNNLDESSLRLYWYSSGNWIKLETNSPTWVYGSGVDTANNYVWANVSHFSDYAVGGELKEETQPPNVDNDDSSGSSSSGGGASGEDFYNIVISETDRQSVYKNSSISYIFDLDGNIVRHINFTALNSAGKVAAKVEILNNTSTLVSTPPPNEVFRNLNIWVGNAGWATERNIDDATVVFTVEKSWITGNSIDESSITLYRYSGDTWHELVTRKIAEDGNSLQFEAETTGFSPFAVSGKKTMGETVGEGIIEPTVTAEKTPTPTPTEEKGIPGFGIFAGLSVLLTAVQLLRKKG